MLYTSFDIVVPNLSKLNTFLTIKSVSRFIDNNMIVGIFSIHGCTCNVTVLYVGSHFHDQYLRSSC